MVHYDWVDWAELEFAKSVPSPMGLTLNVVSTYKHANNRDSHGVPNQRWYSPNYDLEPVLKVSTGAKWRIEAPTPMPAGSTRRLHVVRQSWILLADNSVLKKQTTRSPCY